MLSILKTLDVIIWTEYTWLILAETKTLFEKLAFYCGSGITDLISDTSSGRHVFRIQGSRVYFVRETLANFAISVKRDNLLSLGNCLGKVSFSVIDSLFETLTNCAS